MRVGIMSMQRICNYGSFLQAYCLKNIIESLGHDVEFVDYKPGKIYYRKEEKNILREIKTVGRDWCMDLITNCVPLLKIMPESVRYSLEFKRKYAEEYLPLLGISRKKNYHAEVDTLVIGSDEVFNCFQKNPKTGYCLELFGKNTRASKVITYAASFGNTTLKSLVDAGKHKEVGHYLRKMDAISVRDKNSAHIVEKMTKKKPNENMDPVLMYDFKSQVSEVCELKSFLVVYAYRHRIKSEEVKWIKNFAQSKGLKIVSIGGYQSFSDIRVEGSPFEIMDYIRKADYVFSDTFHGTIFSIVNHRRFGTFIRRGHGSVYGNSEKLTDLLARLELQNRIITCEQDLINVMSSDIDYNSVDLIIENEKKNTIDYLNRNIGC